MQPTVTFNCTLNNHPYGVMFTEGKKYVGTHYRNRMYSVMDDLGRERHLLLEEGKAIFPLGTETAQIGARSYYAEFEEV